MDDAQNEGGRPAGLVGLDEEAAVHRKRTRALVLQRRTAPDGWAARSRRPPAAALPGNRDVLDAALALLVTLAQAVVAGADGVSITLPRHGRLTTVAASDDEVVELDHEQNASGAGPSLDASRGHRVHADCLSAETRWPAFVRKARARRLETVLSTPLLAANRPVGALTVYSHTAGALAAEETGWAELFAAEAATLVAPAAPSGGPDAAVGRQIREAMQSRETIAHAQGVIMQRDGVCAGAAYAALRDTSRRTGRPLRDVATECLSTIRRGAPQVVPTGEGSDSKHTGRQGGPAAETVLPPTASARSVPPTVDISPRQPDGTVYLTVGGTWIHSAGGDMHSLFDGVRRRRPSLVIADLADVAMMDTGGGEALATSSRRLTAAGCRLELHNPPPHLWPLLQSTGLAQMVTVNSGEFASPACRGGGISPRPPAD